MLMPIPAISLNSFRWVYNDDSFIPKKTCPGTPSGVFFLDDTDQY